MMVPAAAWRQWAGSDEAFATLLARLSAIGAKEQEAARLLAQVTEDPGWRGLARLDAGLQRVAALIEARALSRDSEASRIVGVFLAQAGQENESESNRWGHYASAQPAPPSPAGEEQLKVRGTVLVRARGRVRQHLASLSAQAAVAAKTSQTAALSGVVDPGRPSVGRTLFSLLREDGLLQLSSLTIQRQARLVILDEAFRGLERQHRRRLLARARGIWKEATLLAVSHDLEETLSFDQVLVVEEGRVVEAGAPAGLAGRVGGRYAALLTAEKAAHATFSESSGWRRLRLEGGAFQPEMAGSGDREGAR